MPNSLTRTAGLTLGPVALDTLLKHYFDRVKKEKAESDLPFTQLRQDELLYDEAFNLAKKFLDVATHHSVEELQALSNTRTLSPPWVHVARVTVPMSYCDEAATLLIHALGGEEHTSLLVGGTKWWQVRGIAGIAGEWVTARKDWEEAKKRQKAFQKKRSENSSSLHDTTNTLPSSMSDPTDPDEDVDDMRCILYTHGGGYYFGSLDQERYCLQRLARKIKGRTFAINYRLAPQYPFPCALQDLVAAYLYLIRPPPDASHSPVKPSHIVVAGDSAGGGLTLGLLQVLRDTGQPLPAGGVLISPWCDLTHSFPSIHINTHTDILPLYGLSLHKPSALWPPPSEEMTHRIHTGLRRKIRQIVRVTVSGTKAGEATAPGFTQHGLSGSQITLGSNDRNSTSSDVEATASLPSVDEKNNQAITLETKSGEKLRIDSQIQLYTQNSLLGHPLVSPALSYLGGLPPLLIIASDKEVLRDEIIYSAHKAADPSGFPPRDEARSLYPPLVGIEHRYGPTPIHLQVYDDTAHVLPVLFPFTTPGKYCYRAIATFTKHVTEMLHPSKLAPSSSEAVAPVPYQSLASPASEDFSDDIPIHQVTRILSDELICKSPSTQDDIPSALNESTSMPESSALRLSLSRPTFFSFQTKPARAPILSSASDRPLRRVESGLLRPQVGSPGKLRRHASMIETTWVCYAGEASVYQNDQGTLTWKEGMIRERVSTQGIVRPLELSDAIDALHVPPEVIGVLSERSVRRYLAGKALFDRKYAKESSAIEKERNRNIDLARKDIARNLTHLQESQGGRAPGKRKETSQAFRDGLKSPSGTWGWAWADERPPPSSIVSRRDTEESRRLARIADQSVLQDEAHMNSNSLWAVIVKSLTTSPPKERPVSDSEAVEPSAGQKVIKKSKSVFTSLRARERPPKNGS